jgi:hypothetical protein
MGQNRPLADHEQHIRESLNLNLRGEHGDKN